MKRGRSGSLKSSRLYTLARQVRRGLKDCLKGIRSVDRRSVTLEPEGAVRGNLLLAYIVGGFFEAPDSRLMRSHTHYWESMEIARAWVERGYRVDVIDNYNYEYRPTRRYDFLVGARMILERMGSRINDDCTKILHIDTSHWLYHRRAQYERLCAIKERRGVALEARKLLEPNQAIEYADVATMLGNDFTEGTYAYAGKPIHRVPISTVRPAPWPEDKDFESARHHFLWFGSQALVHKGLDRVLEAFAAMPDLELTICGPTHEERDFREEYRRELFEMPNIHTVGWVDVAGREFDEITRRCGSFVYPTCAEGQSGATVLCMHAGLVPVVSRQSGVDVPAGGGSVLQDSSITEIQDHVRALAQMPADRFREMARVAWEHARDTHTRQRFARSYRAVLDRLLGDGRGPTPADPEIAGVRPVEREGQRVE